MERQPRDDRPALMMADQKEWRQEDVKGLTLTEFKEKFPQVSTYGLEDPLNVFLENGEILIEREWNGEKYILGNGKSYRPVYRQLDEDDYEIIGYIED